MGRRKRVKTLNSQNTSTKRNSLIGDGEISLSLSSSNPHSYRTRSQNQALVFEREHPSVKKKVAHQDDSSNSSSLEEVKVQVPSQEEEEESSVEESSMNDLPPEMLMEILKCVDTRTLFNCRLVNRQWSEISSGILCNRSNARIRFDCSEKRNEILRHQRLYSTSRKRSLQEFLKCMKTSKNSTYSQFSFTIFNLKSPVLPNFLAHDDLQEFLSDFSSSSNKRIKGLFLSFLCLTDVEEFQILVQKLRDLLLKIIPRLQELSLEFRFSRLESQVKLFPNPNEADGNPEQVQIAVPVHFQLVHLKSIRFESDVISAHPEFSKDLLNAAVNLTNIYVAVRKSVGFEILHSLGKMHLVKEALILIDGDFFSALQVQQQEQQQQQRSTFPSFPQLENLDLRLHLNETNQNMHASAAHFLANLFESCKKSLTTLKLQSWSSGFACLPGFQLPTLKNLKKLEIDLSIPTECILPPGSRALNIFPAVNTLDLNKENWVGDFPREDSIPLLPNVKILNINEYNFTDKVISLLASMCPNLTHLHITKSSSADELPTLNFFLVGRSIWTHMKQLESLQVHINLNDREENNPIALDSCFTGISIENCQRLHRSKKSKGRNDESKQKLLTVREHPSILDMTSLKTLKINPYWRGKLLDQKYFFTNKLTWISQEYAFKFMPHLNPNQKPKPEEKALE